MKKFLNPFVAKWSIALIALVVYVSILGAHVSCAGGASKSASSVDPGTPVDVKISVQSRDGNRIVYELQWNIYQPNVHSYAVAVKLAGEKTYSITGTHSKPNENKAIVECYESKNTENKRRDFCIIAYQNSSDYTGKWSNVCSILVPLMIPSVGVDISRQGANDEVNITIGSQSSISERIRIERAECNVSGDIIGNWNIVQELQNNESVILTKDVSPLFGAWCKYRASNMYKNEVTTCESKTIIGCRPKKPVLNNIIVNGSSVEFKWNDELSDDTNHTLSTGHGNDENCGEIKIVGSKSYLAHNYAIGNYYAKIISKGKNFTQNESSSFPFVVGKDIFNSSELIKISNGSGAIRNTCFINNKLVEYKFENDAGMSSIFIQECPGVWPALRFLLSDFNHHNIKSLRFMNFVIDGNGYPNVLCLYDRYVDIAKTVGGFYCINWDGNKWNVVNAEVPEVFQYILNLNYNGDDLRSALDKNNSWCIMGPDRYGGDNAYSLMTVDNRGGFKCIDISAMLPLAWKTSSRKYFDLGSMRNNGNIVQLFLLSYNTDVKCWFGEYSSGKFQLEQIFSQSNVNIGAPGVCFGKQPSILLGVGDLATSPRLVKYSMIMKQGSYWKSSPLPQQDKYSLIGDMWQMKSIVYSKDGAKLAVLLVSDYKLAWPQLYIYDGFSWRYGFLPDFIRGKDTDFRKFKIDFDEYAKINMVVGFDSKWETWKEVRP